MSKSSKYLYDKEMKDFANLPYKDVLVLKIALAKKLMHKLVHTENMENPSRMNDVNNSIKFNKNLLMEIGLSDKDVSEELKKNIQHKGIKCLNK